MSICRGVAGKRGCSPKGFFIHNDAGGAYLNADWWANAYASGRHNLENGFVHYHVDKNHVVQCENDDYMAWHCGNTYYNNNYLSLEVDQSMCASDKEFLEAEDRALRLVAEKFKQYGLTPNNDTIKLHKEVFATACPHRSVALHGGDNACKQYFINKVKEYMNEEKPKEKPKEKSKNKGEEEMRCTFQIDNGNTVYYFDGYNIKALNHEDQLKILQTIYKDNNGKDLPHYKWSSKAPWYVRLLSALQRPNVTKL